MQLTEQRGDGDYYLEARRTFNRVFRCLKAVCSESKKRTRYFVVCCCYHDYDDDDDDDELRTTMLMIMSAFVCPPFPRSFGSSNAYHQAARLYGTSSVGRGSVWVVDRIYVSLKVNDYYLS